MEKGFCLSSMLAPIDTSQGSASIVTGGALGDGVEGGLETNLPLQHCSCLTLQIYVVELVVSGSAATNSCGMPFPLCAPAPLLLPTPTRFLDCYEGFR